MKFHQYLLLFIMVGLTDCQETKEPRVRIEKTDGRYQVLVDDNPFVVRGAGINWEDGHNFKALKAAGGNSFRTWRTDHLELELDSAAKYDLMVAVGFNLEKELHGFDYRKSIEEVATQLERVKEIVDRYKDHPNILCWVAGNELNLILTDEGERPLVDIAVYEALSDIVDYIHQEDPNHPVTTAFAGVRKMDIDLALKHCPNLDFLSFQVYASLGIMPELVRDAGIDKPFMITEFGPTGHWEMPSTSWGREIEEPSAIKAERLAERMRKGILEDSSGLNIGHFVFEWGQKQERTPTWYGIFNKTGEPDARIDEVTKFWKGAYPDNRAPLVDGLVMNGQQATDNISVVPTQKVDAWITFQEPETGSLTYRWVLMTEVMDRSKGGAYEQEPETIPIELINPGNKITFKAPAQSGAYRLFAYVYDGHGKVGNANIPFYVQ